mmetsp:Transcript_67280/g.82442  ORF Transcript_67280/g.82442 Transcript_67280/m.82442 type:complete len:148 (+) Transcript_67280:28-471(+)
MSAPFKMTTFCLILLLLWNMIYNSIGCCCVKNNECWKFTCCKCYNDINDEIDCSFTCGNNNEFESCKRFKDACIKDESNGAQWRPYYCDKNKMMNECTKGWHQIMLSQELESALYNSVVYPTTNDNDNNNGINAENDVLINREKTEL